MKQPLVSVRVVTYNHEKYIQQCLEGILMQRTDFPFEIVIGEDCSTDHTQEIVFDYEKRFPEIIRVITSEKNVGGMQNIIRVHQACSGKYIANCEGDDYWIDPLKLQKQVDFMEAHPGMTLCFHNAIILNEATAATRIFFETQPHEILSFDEVCNITTPTAGVMARSDVLATQPEWRLKIWCGDLLARLWCAHHGTVGYLNEIMSVYRRHPGGLDIQMRSQPQKYYEDTLYVYREFDRETNFEHTDVIQRQTLRTQERLLFRRLGRLYFLLRPGQIVARLKEYAGWIDRQKRLNG
jgi:glycosyltransferase involved in cell wall biosynthesis